MGTTVEPTDANIYLDNDVSSRPSKSQVAAAAAAVHNPNLIQLPVQERDMVTMKG